MKGVVKWWNDSKGYGFIMTEKGPDVFVHHASLIMEGFRTLNEGQSVTFEIVEGAKGQQAKNVIPGPLKELESEDPVPSRDEPELLAVALFDSALKVVSITPDGTYRFLDDLAQLHNICYVCSLETVALSEAVEEFEALINGRTTKEADLQDFFERNPSFILNDEYKAAHPHIVLERDSSESLIPDFVLEPVDDKGLCDLLELKHPSASVFVMRRGRGRYSAAVMDACAQLREYSAFFEQDSNREAVYEKYGLRSYRPRMFVIIGRRGSVDPLQLRRAQDDLPSLTLRTYDDILARMTNRMKLMKGSNSGA